MWRAFTGRRSLFQGGQEAAARWESGEVGADIARCHARRHHVEHAGVRSSGRGGRGIATLVGGGSCQARQRACLVRPCLRAGLDL